MWHIHVGKIGWGRNFCSFEKNFRKQKKSKSKVQKKKFLLFSKIICPYILLVKTILRQQYPAYLWRIFCQAWFFKNCYIFVKKKLIKKYDFHNFQLCAVWVHILFCLSKFIKMCSTYPYLFESLIMLSRMRLAPSETNLNYVKIMWFFTKVSRFSGHCREMNPISARKIWKSRQF